MFLTSYIGAAGRLARLGVAASVLAVVGLGAPMLRLNQTSIGPVSVATGTSPAPRTVEAFNAGDGTLNLTFTASDQWLSATAGAPRQCSDIPSRNCIPITITFNTTALAKGTHTGTLLVADPNAWDAPQRITVVVQMGGGVPDELNLFVPTNGSSVQRRFVTASEINATANTTSGGNWLSVALDGTGTFRFNVPYLVTARHLQGMAAGTYNGTITTTGSSLPQENKTVNVKLTATGNPILQPSSDQVQVRFAANIQQNSVVVLQNIGAGTLTISEVTATTASGGNWLSVVRQETVLTLVFKTEGMSPGRYQGTVTVKSNAANGDLAIPVSLEVVPQSAPMVAAQGAVNNATFQVDDPIAQGGIAAVFGEQFLYGNPAGASAVPLPTKLGETRVLVNGIAAPLYFASYNQINFQIPFEVPPGVVRVQVERNGQVGNSASLRVSTAAPRLLRLGIGDYGILVNQDGSFPIPRTPGVNSRPAKAGEVLVIYAIGLGRTTPAVPTGAPAPNAEPLARVEPLPRIYIGGGLSPVAAHPIFVGQSPNFVGLYQMNVIVPGNTPPGSLVPVFIEQDGAVSNTVYIAIE